MTYSSRWSRLKRPYIDYFDKHTYITNSKYRLKQLPTLLASKWGIPNDSIMFQSQEKYPKKTKYWPSSSSCYKPTYIPNSKYRQKQFLTLLALKWDIPMIFLSGMHIQSSLVPDPIITAHCCSWQCNPNSDITLSSSFYKDVYQLTITKGCKHCEPKWCI